MDLPGAGSHSADGARVSHRKSQVWYAFDRNRARIVGWIGDAQRLTQHQVGRPLHSELLLWHSDQGVLTLHAGFVARNGTGVLLAGPSGSGKSTAALACLLAGLDYLADDYVGIEATNGSFVGHSFYCSTHVAPDHLERFPVFFQHGIAGTVGWEDKLLVLLSDVAPDRLRADARIQAIALPRVAGSPDTVIRPATKVEAFARVAPQIARPDGPARIRQLVEAVPSYWLELGRDLDQIPERLASMLADL